MVVAHHLPAFCTSPEWVNILGLGNPWVAIFIALSGYCLFLPAAGRDKPEMPRPFWEFMRRRARRIIPPWYASLVLCVLVGWFFAQQQFPPPFSFLPKDIWDILTHLTLTHSMVVYAGSINRPGYTLGTEWQPYILMILFLLVARRLGWWVLLIGIGLLPFIPIAPVEKIVSKVFNPTFTMPFVLGMLGARATRTLPHEGERVPRHTAIATVLTLLGVTGYLLLTHRDHDRACWFAGLATAAGCFWMTRYPQALPTRFFASAPISLLGSFSYSLYLTHFALLALLHFTAIRLGLTDIRAFYLLFLPALPLIFAFASLFYYFFEKPFLNAPSIPKTKEG
jgi:peptidoglycan/LPS O-acetylase OafA/YrhL